jgi:hypothetical protein
MRITDGLLQPVVDSFDRDSDPQATKTFIKERLASALSNFLHQQLTPDDIKWDKTCGYFSYRIYGSNPSNEIRLFPESTRPEAGNLDTELAQLG